ncbi:glycosyltransferase family 4 protein [Niveispirillum fermenti]|uniref:glycosyltransferase family 4 protein n=1 Tax=Niveispirillum fermenti TaxID=1233113 RepID=UPI003A88327F
MRILFVHQNFPGQFKHLVAALVDTGHEVVALAITGQNMPGVRLVDYKPTRGTTPGMHPWAADTETKVIRGEACALKAQWLKEQGFTPDVIVGHPGWGEMLFLKDIWPRVPQLHFLEFHYSPAGADVGFDPEFSQQGWRAQARIRAKNAVGLLSLNSMDAAYSPTQWQKSSYPTLYHGKIDVVHDGIDTDALTPSPQASGKLGDLPVRAGMEIVTFVNRNLEPYRGYHSFMRALPRMQALRPEAIFIVVGADGVSYGAAAPAGQTWKNIFLEEMGDRIDRSRLFFLGTVPYTAFITILRMSAVHLYLTYPFVLSWSMMEAMSCGALVVGSRTEPVEEVLEHGHNGLLVDFFDYDGIADTVAEGLANPQRYLPLRANARQTIIDRYDLRRHCLPRQGKLIEKLLA